MRGVVGEPFAKPFLVRGGGVAFAVVEQRIDLAQQRREFFHVGGRPPAHRGGSSHRRAPADPSPRQGRVDFFEQQHEAVRRRVRLQVERDPARAERQSGFGAGEDPGPHGRLFEVQRVPSDAARERCHESDRGAAFRVVGGGLRAPHREHALLAFVELQDPVLLQRRQRQQSLPDPVALQLFERFGGERGRLGAVHETEGQVGERLLRRQLRPRTGRCRGHGQHSNQKRQRPRSQPRQAGPPPHARQCRGSRCGQGAPPACENFTPRRAPPMTFVAHRRRHVWPRSPKRPVPRVPPSTAR